MHIAAPLTRRPPVSARRHAALDRKDFVMPSPHVRRFLGTSIVVASALLLVPGAAAHGQELGRPIVRQTVIDEPGVYTVHRNVSTGNTDPVITIRASNVFLNLNGRTLSGPGNKQGIGILVDGVTGVCIKDGIVTRTGIGVRVAGSNNVRVEGLKIYGDDLGGSPPDVEVGIMLANSRAVLVKNNVISRVFLGIFVRGGGSGGNRITENTVTGQMNGMLGICYNPVPGSPAAPQGDLVYNNLISRFMTGIATSDQTRNNIFRENDIAYFSMAVSEAVAGSNVFVDNTATMMQP
jgi:parallel beta-helix repeat protein